LGVGDFYFELGIKIIQICLQTRSANGGIITLRELVARVREKQRLAEAARKRRSSTSSQTTQISSEDVMRSIEKLEILGKGFSLVHTGKKSEPMVLSVPLEVNRDHGELMTVAQEIGYVSQATMQSLYGWTTERFEQSIVPLLQEGIVWVDDQNGECYHELSTDQTVTFMYFVSGERCYYFPSIWRSVSESSKSL
jgi:ESCRT-II complex subunit VPS22